ncbi:MAG: DUF1848 family protein [bacterium]
MDNKIIISASRRTDLPAFYADWLIKQFKQERVDVPNPFNKKISTISLSPHHVHSVVLWSKNFSPLLNRIHELKNYQLFFMFTINDSTSLEPHVPLLSDRFEQLDYIVNRFGKERVFIRFDPIVHWHHTNKIKNNLASFETILEKIAKKGISKLKISFMNTHYRKLSTRKFDFIELPLEEKNQLVTRLASLASNYTVTLQFCCNSYLFQNSSIHNIERSSCIDGYYLSEIVGEPTILKKDPSQRTDCACTYSRDIGNYSQICSHSCAYCYANPKRI